MTQIILVDSTHPTPGATFSPDRRYRYTLHRQLGGTVPYKTCLFICLNPSTADETNDDPTVRRCIGFARDWGYTHLSLANAFGLRSTNPKTLYSGLFEPIGSQNNEWIVWETGRADRIVAAWGNHGTHLDRGREVLDMLLDLGYTIHHFGLTGKGQPKNPLYLPKTCALQTIVRAA